jgi:hypothetical protein
MANTTFSGPVRSENGFQTVSKNATTGVVTITKTSGTGSSPTNMTPGAGISNGSGTIHKTSVSQDGNLIITKIFMDVTGLNCGGTAGDIIGVDGAGVAYIAQITAAVNGTIVAGEIKCFEAPTTGDPDIDVYAATEGTGVEDTAIGDLTETQLVDSGDLTLGSVDIFTAFPSADQYLYLVCGTSTAGTYDAGKIEITLYGHAT